MITVSLEPLPQAAQDELRKWLAKDPFKTLQRVVDAKVKVLQGKALNDVLSASSLNLKLESGNQYLVDAQKYQACLDVLNEIVQQADHYSIAKLT